MYYLIVGGCAIGFQFLVFGFWFSVFGFRFLVFGFWFFARIGQLLIYAAVARTMAETARHAVRLGAWEYCNSA